MGLSELDAIAECDAAGLRGRQREAWAAWRQLAPPNYTVLAAYLGWTVSQVCVHLGRAKRKVRRYEQGEPLVVIDATGGEGLSLKEEAVALLQAMQGHAPSCPRALYPEEGDRDRVNARVVLVQDVMRVIREGNHRRAEIEEIMQGPTPKRGPVNAPWC